MKVLIQGKIFSGSQNCENYCEECYDCKEDDCGNDCYDCGCYNQVKEGECTGKEYVPFDDCYEGD